MYDDIPFCGNGILWPGHGPRPNFSFAQVSVLGTVSALLPAVKAGGFVAY